jgi:hypothetical protein
LDRQIFCVGTDKFTVFCPVLLRAGFCDSQGIRWRRVSIDRQISILRRFELSARNKQQRGSDGDQVWRSHKRLGGISLASERSQHEEGSGSLTFQGFLLANSLVSVSICLPSLSHSRRVKASRTSLAPSSSLALARLRSFNTSGNFHRCSVRPGVDAPPRTSANCLQR